MDRLFLDANVLFSAAFREGAGLTRLWRLSGTVLVTSRYALGEARRNLDTTAQRQRLETLIQDLELVAEAPPLALGEEAELPEKDRPILRAAVAARATHLVTGDVSHFGRFFGRTLEGVLVIRPAQYLRSRQG